MRLILVFAILCVVNGFHSLFKAEPIRAFKSKISMQYNVRIINNKRKTDFTAKIPSGGIILDVAEAQGISIPYSCRAGSCSSCVGKLISGTVDQSGQIFLNDKQMDQGFVLTCAASATSDCEIEVEIEDMFYSLNPDMVS